MRQQSYKAVMLATTLIVGSSCAIPLANADTANNSAQPAPQNNQLDQRLKVSDEGFRAERDIRAARIAIFEGGIDNAKKFVKDAETELQAVKKQDGVFASTSMQGTNAKLQSNAGSSATPAGSATTQAASPDLIPIDGQMIVADNMVLTPDKAAKVKEANEHLKNGETQKAMDTLKQGQIDVAFTRLLMPLSTTTTHVDTAGNLLNEGKYYEANLALKAAQDLMQTDTVAFDDSAAQASKITGVPAVAAPAGSNTASTTAAPAKK